MRIVWHGHSCFEICGDGTSVMIDPHDGSLGIKPPEASADMVLATHGCIPSSVIGGDRKYFIERSGKFSYKGTEVEGFSVNAPGARSNVLYRIKMDGMTLCHCGDLGAVPDENITNMIKGVDFLIVPAGEVNTLNIKDLFRFIDSISPKIVIPMHYYVCGLSLPLRNLDLFLEYAGNVVRVGNEADISEDELPSQREYWIFSL